MGTVFFLSFSLIQNTRIRNFEDCRKFICRHQDDDNDNVMLFEVPKLLYSTMKIENFIVLYIELYYIKTTFAKCSFL